MLPFAKILLRISVINSDISFLIQRHERKFWINLHFYISVISMEITDAYARAYNLSNTYEIIVK